MSLLMLKGSRFKATMPIPFLLALGRRAVAELSAI
jgi:hypothetical protein